VTRQKNGHARQLFGAADWNAGAAFLYFAWQPDSPRFRRKNDHITAAP
jgi:hypothetical protein